ncbi:MAG TPA: nuclear transport factor 2 family protein [Steroidobacter sp.]|uniref:ester cyclase n=1 Tax=Steroidobacter sp. TaxID=1978227 RepID=UPI002EDB0B4D
MSVLQTLPVEQMKSIVSKLAAVKSRQDLEAALTIYHADGELLSPPVLSRAKGHAALRNSLATFFRFAPDYEVDLHGQAADGETLCSWGEIRFTPAYSFRGDPPNGKRIRTPVFILFRFRDEKVFWESFHFDLADVARQAGLPAEAFQHTG